MLPAKDELSHYAECLTADLTSRQKGLVERAIQGMTAEQAEAWMALLTAAEGQGKAEGEPAWDYDALGNSVQLPANPGRGEHDADQPIIRT